VCGFGGGREAALRREALGLHSFLIGEQWQTALSLSGFSMLQKAFGFAAVDAVC
jgi:hypothetical protein